MSDIDIRATAANAESPQLQQVIPWPLANYSHFRKCGEITVSADEQSFGFNCSFCPGICLEWDVFRQHIRQEHGLEITEQQRASGCNDQMLVDEVLLLEQQQIEERSAQPTPADLMMMIMDMDMDLVENDEDIANVLSMEATVEAFNDDKRITKSNWHEATTTTTTNITSTTTMNTKPSVAAIEFENTQGLKETIKSTLEEGAYKNSTSSTKLGLLDVSSQEELSSTSTMSPSSPSSLPYSMNIEWLDMGMSFVSESDKATIDFSSLVATVPPPQPIVSTSCGDKEGEMAMVYFVESPLAADLFSCSSMSPSQALEELEEANEEFTFALTEAVDPLVVDFDDVDDDDDDVDIDVDDVTFTNASMDEAENMFLVASSHGTEEELPTPKGHHHHDNNNNYEDYNDEDDEIKVEVDRTNTVKEDCEETNDDGDDDEEKSADSRMATPAIEEEYDDDVDIRKPLTQRELLRNKEIVGCIINVYEKHEKLWNPKHHQYKYNTKSSVYNELCEPLERDYKIRLSGPEIFAVVKEVRGRYRRELTKCNACNDENYKSNLWYFESMHFLRSVIEHRRAERLEAKIAAERAESEISFETDSEQSSKLALYREALSYIIDAYKRQECLWNPQHFDYVNGNQMELYHEISVQLNEDLQYEMSGEECFKEIQKIRTRYRKELRAIIMHKGLYIPKLWCFDEMDFLYKICQDQIFAKIGKKKGIVETQPKSKFLKAERIVFRDEEAHLQFIEIYKNYPALWEVDHPDFRSTAYRNKALVQMLEEFNATFDITSTVEQLEKTLFQMRKDFSAEKQMILTTNSENSSPSSSLIYEKLSSFLEQNIGPFQCEICQEMLKTSDQFKVHRSSHDGTMPFICTLCGKGFQTPCNLTVHIRRHRRDFPYACEKCEKRFATSTEVAIHMRTHTGERPYVCDLCGKTFKTWSFFDVHRRTHLNQPTFHCPICDKGFYEKNRFTDHMNCHLNIREHLCNVCGKTFTTFSNLKKHTELHMTVKKYKCDSCGKRFAQCGGLRWHKIREHTNETYEQ